MDTREDIRRGIRLVQNLHREGEDIVPWKLGGPQQVSVGVEGGDHQEQRHAGKKEGAVPVKLLFRPLEEQVQEHSGNVYKPQQIGHDEIFHEGNLIVQPYMDYMIRQVGRLSNQKNQGR